MGGLEAYRREVLINANKKTAEEDDHMIELTTEFANIFQNPVFPLGGGQR